MSLQVETIPFAFRSGPGSQTITQVQYPSMQAKAVIFHWSDDLSFRWCVGSDDGTTRISNAAGLNETFGVYLSARAFSTIYSLLNVQAQAFFGGASLHVAGYVTAFNVGSFDIQLDINNIVGQIAYATVIGGSDVECAVGVYDVSAGSGSITGLAFKPAALFHIGVPDVGDNGFVAGANPNIGFATLCPNGDGDQVGLSFAAGSISSISASYQITGILSEALDATGTTSDTVSVSGYTADGFTVSANALSSGWNIGYLAIGGDAVSANLVKITQPTTTGVQNTAVDASNPVAVFIGSTCKVNSSGDVPDGNLVFGVYDGFSQMSGWIGTTNGAAFPYTRDCIQSTTKTITLATATGPGTSTVNAAASITLSANNIAANWTTVDSTQREVWALVLAQNLSGSANPCGDNPVASITVIKNATPIPGGATDFPFGTDGLTPSTFILQDGGSQLFSGLSPGTYGVTEIPPTGWNVSYLVSNGDPHTAIVIAGTESVTVTVTNTFQSSPTGSGIFRVLRRWALPYAGNRKIFIPRIEIIAQMGVGNTSAANPVMYLRISPDGGETWGDYRQMPLGAAGDTMIRVYLTRFCQGLRNPVAELICDDPVVVAWVACELPQDFTAGTS